MNQTTEAKDKTDNMTTHESDEQGPEQLILTYKQGQWIDQNGRRVVNPKDLISYSGWWIEYDNGDTAEWPGPYENVSICMGDHDEFCDRCNCEKGVRLIPPTGSENSAHGFTEGADVPPSSASEQTSASKRDERYITAPSGKRITESEWMNGGDPEWTDEFKQKTFDNFHRQEFASPQQQPDTETQHEKSLRLLHKYLNETPKEEIEALLDSIKNVGTNGPTVEEYFQSLGGQPDELSKAIEKATEHCKKRCDELEMEAHLESVAAKQYADELSKAQERIAELESENRDLRKLTDELLKGHE